MLLFVVDASRDDEKLEKSEDVFKKLVREKRMTGKPFILAAHKQVRNLAVQYVEAVLLTWLLLTPMCAIQGFAVQ